MVVVVVVESTALFHFSLMLRSHHPLADDREGQSARSSQSSSSSRWLMLLPTTIIRASSVISSVMSSTSAPGAAWSSTCIRVKDAGQNVDFFKNHFGMQLVKEVKREANSSFFLSSPTSKECIELWHEHGAEKDPNLQYDSGNNEPKRGFGHLAFMMNDVYAASESLEKAGVAFRKRPDEGRMKGIAFCLSPDGYWIELVKRAEEAKDTLPTSSPFNYAQTMIRVKDPKKSIAFYVDILGGTLINERHFSDFSLYFVMWPEDKSGVPSDPTSQEAYNYMKSSLHPVLELTHNHGTENDATFKYHDGNSAPMGFKCIRFLKPESEDGWASLKSRLSSFSDASELSSESDTWTDPDGYHVGFL